MIFHKELSSKKLEIHNLNVEMTEIITLPNEHFDSLQIESFSGKYNVSDFTSFFTAKRLFFWLAGY